MIIQNPRMSIHWIFVEYILCIIMWINVSSVDNFFNIEYSMNIQLWILLWIVST